MTSTPSPSRCTSEAERGAAMLTSIELFAGIAGFSSPHIQPIAFVEIEPNCRAVLRRHYPGVPILENVKDCGAHNLPWANVIKFGFPCQDLSVAGNRAGLNGARSGLFYEATRIVNELRPDYAVFENVPGLLSSGVGRDFLAVLTELDRIGFAGGWRTLNAEYYGVAQRRRRIFGVFASRHLGATRCAEILSLIPGMSGHSPAGGKARANVAATIRGGAAGNGTNRPGRRGDDDQNIGAALGAALGAAFGRNRGLGQENEIDTLVIPFDTAQITSNVNRTRAEPGLPASTLNGSGQMHVAVFGGNNTSGERSVAASLTAHPTGRYDFEIENLVAATLNSGGNNGGFRTEPGAHLVCGALSATHGGPDDNSGQAGHLIAQFDGHSANGVQERVGVANTLDGDGRDGIISSIGVRRLTPRECERLQGFPDDYTAWGVDEQGQRVEMSDSARYRMIGNAVCRSVSDWLDQRIVAVYSAAGG